MSTFQKNELLKTVMRYGALPREALFLLRDDRRYTERIIKSCIDEKLVIEHVRKDTVKVEYRSQYPRAKIMRIVDGRKEKTENNIQEEHHYFRTLKYYTLSDKGIKYIKELEEFLPEDIAAAELLRKQFSRGGKSIDRLLGIAQSELMMWAMHDIDKDVYEYNLPQVKLYDGYGFANAKTIKYVAQNGGIHTTAAVPTRDYDRGRYNGCFFSKTVAIAVYNNFTPGFGWSKQAAAPEKRAIDLFAYTVIRENMLKEPLIVCSCVLVKNPSHLKQIILDLPGARRLSNNENSKAYKLGDPYPFMYALPIDRIGVFHLTDILDNNIQAQEISVYKECWRRGYKSDDFLITKSAVKIPEDNLITRYVVSLSLNVKEMQKVLQSMQIHRDIPFGVICYKWQMPYWRAIMGKDFRLLDAATFLR